MKKLLKLIDNTIRKNQRFLITSHVRQDGDNIGSQLALYWALMDLGKEVIIQNVDPVPDTFGFLPGADRIFISDKVEDNRDVLFVLDVGDIERTGGITTEKFATVIKIDHHHSQKPFADIDFVRKDASSTCELLYEYFKAVGQPITPKIATCLYTGILCETGSFQFANTTAPVLRISADLALAGADPTNIARMIYEDNSFARIRLLGECLSGMKLYSEGKIAVMTVDREMIRKWGCQSWETENFIQHARSIRGVAVAVFLQEISQERYKISFRSRREVDVAAIAEELGGGGHKYASGCRMSGTLETIKEDILTRIIRAKGGT